MPINYGNATHYPCGHERTKVNSTMSGPGRWRCRECAHATRKRREALRKCDVPPPYKPYKPTL